MNIINIDLGGFVFALDHHGIFIRVRGLGEGWLDFDFSGNGFTCWSRWRDCPRKS